MEGLGLGLAGAAFWIGLAWLLVRRMQYNDPIDRLERLARLHRDGQIDDEELAALKQRQIRRMKWD